MCLIYNTYTNIYSKSWLNSPWREEAVEASSPSKDRELWWSNA